MAIVMAKGLSKHFGKGSSQVMALDHIDFTLEKGELSALVGPDGAGKTTFLRLICGLMEADAGALSVLGQEVSKNPQAIQNRLGYMPQKFGLYEDLTVLENMNLYANLHGVGGQERIERFARLLSMTGLEKFGNRLAGKLSGGMKQKLGLACTLVRKPDLLLLDEPTVGVDPLSRRELWHIIQKMVQEDSLTVLVSTAYMDEAALCQKVHVFNQGKIIACGTPEEIASRVAGRCYEASLGRDASVRQAQYRLCHDPAVIDAVPLRGRVRFTVRPNEMPKLASNWQIEAVRPRLEDAVMELLKNGSDIEEVASDTMEMVGSKGKNKDTEIVDIEVENLVKKFGDFTAVANTSFQVHRGEVFGLLGPNGAGKTTTFRMLCGLLSATSGKLSAAGVNLRSARREARAHIGYVAQKFSLYGMLTVQENLHFFGGAYGLYGRKLDQRMQEIMEEFGLVSWAKTEASRLPGGYKQRLAMAAALIHKPQILFLDEPTSGIDPLARRTFWQQITRLSAGGTTVIITTHFMDEAEYCDRFMIQDQGKMLIIGKPEDIRKKYHMPGADMNELFIRIVEEGRKSSS